jgi:hypothetical protein
MLCFIWKAPQTLGYSSLYFNNKTKQYKEKNKLKNSSIEQPDTPVCDNAQKFTGNGKHK